MPPSSNTEYWLRGPVADIPALLQPVAHALLQSRDEVNALMEGFPEGRLWDRPGGVAPPGFHLQHLAGVLDRLLTYAKGDVLSPRQLEELGAEGQSLAEEGSWGDGSPAEGRSLGSGGSEDGGGTAGAGELAGLLERYNRQIDKALLQLAATPELSLTEPRGVGRARVPSTVGGLLFHAAEHSMRHTGQLLVTVRILQSIPPAGNRWE
jgi:DinB superfamily